MGTLHYATIALQAGRIINYDDIIFMFDNAENTYRTYHAAGIAINTSGFVLGDESRVNGLGLKEMSEGLKTQFVQKCFSLRGLTTDDTFEIEPDGQDNQRSENHPTLIMPGTTGSMFGDSDKNGYGSDC